MRLNLSPAVERYELIAKADTQDQKGVFIWARPALSDVVEDASHDDTLVEYAEQLRALAESQEGGNTSVGDMLRADGRFGVLLAKAIAVRTIERWEGIEDPDGTAAPVSRDRIEALLDHPVIYKIWTEIYLSRWFTVVTEKNVSAPSLNGTTAGAPSTAKPARASAKNARGKSTRRKA